MTIFLDRIHQETWWQSFFAEENGHVYVFHRENCRGTRREKKRTSSLFPRRESQFPRRVPRRAGFRRETLSSVCLETRACSE